MRKQRRDRYRTVELVIYVGDHMRHASLFAVMYNRGDASRRELRRMPVDLDVPIDSAEACLALAEQVARSLRESGLPPRR